MNKSTVLLIIVLLIAFSFRVGYSFSSPVKSWDETVYANLGWDIKSNPFDYGFENWADKNPVMWDKAGFRAPLLPYLIALYYTVFGNNYFLINFVMPIIGTIGILLVFLLAKEMFNEGIALYSAIFLAFLPLHVIISGKILTDVFVTTLLTLTVLFFWLGFEKNKQLYKILFGVSLGLSILARYTAIFMPLVFMIYLLVRHKNLNFIRNKWNWLSVFSFLIVLLPWLIYSYFEYNNPLGALLHAKIAANYFGGQQPWYFFFINSFAMFSIITFTSIVGLILILRKIRVDLKKNIKYTLLIFWLLAILLFILLTPHKEDRFILPVTPALVIFSAVLIDSIKKYQKYIVTVLSLILLFSLTTVLYIEFFSSYNIDTSCFLKSMNYLKGVSENSIIFAESSPIVYYYTHKENHFITHGDIESLITTYYVGRPAYLLVSSLDNTLGVKDGLSNKFDSVLRCPISGDPKSIVFKYGD